MNKVRFIIVRQMAAESAQSYIGMDQDPFGSYPGTRTVDIGRHSFAGYSRRTGGSVLPCFLGEVTWSGL